MARCIIAQPLWLTQTDPRIARVSAWGGFWRPDLPVGNLIDASTGAIARTEDCARGSATAWFDLGATRDTLVAAIPASNASPAARVRLRGYGALGEAPVADTGWTNFFPDLFPLGSVDWGHPSIFSLTVDAETALLFPQPWVHVFPSAVTARYWLIEIDDPANSDGFIELSRVILAPGYRPTYNMAYGAAVRVVDPSEVQRSYGGRVYGERRPKYRVATFQLSHILKNEALVNIHDMAARQGVTGEVFFVWDSDDLPNIGRLSFLGRLAELSALEQSFYDRMGCNFQIEERVG